MPRSPAASAAQGGAGGCGAMLDGRLAATAGGPCLLSPPKRSRARRVTMACSRNCCGRGRACRAAARCRLCGIQTAPGKLPSPVAPQQSLPAAFTHSFSTQLTATQQGPPRATMRAAPGRQAALQVSCSGQQQQCVKFRPCIDIHQGKVKQIVGSTLKDLPSTSGAGDGNAALKTNFVSDKPSSWYAELYQRDSLTGGHVIMLGSDDASRQTAFGALQAWPGGLQLGGGVTTDNAMDYLDAGASHVIVTSFVFREGQLEQERLQQLVKLVGRRRLVLDLSCRQRDGQYWVVTDRWQRFSSLALSEASLAQLAASCDEFLVHGVDVEGLQLGIDDELVTLLARWSPIPVTYAGGARTLADLERVAAAGQGRVDITVGSALDIFGGQLAYADVVAWHNSQQRLVAAAQQ